MLITCWSVKGGSGTTVVASSLALLAAHFGFDTCLVDLAGDAPASLGMSEPSGPGIGHWLSAAPNVPAASLHHLEVPLTDQLRLLPLGQPIGPSLSESSGASSGHALDAHPAYRTELIEYLADSDRTFVVDGGSRGLHPGIRRAATHDVLVLRGCYLALRRAVQLAQAPSGIVFINEPGRALRRPEVERASGAPIIAEIPWDPVVARSIDAGLLASRLPRSLRDSLGALEWW